MICQRAAALDLSPAQAREGCNIWFGQTGRDLERTDRGGSHLNGILAWAYGEGRPADGGYPITARERGIQGLLAAAQADTGNPVSTAEPKKGNPAEKFGRACLRNKAGHPLKSYTNAELAVRCLSEARPVRYNDLAAEYLVGDAALTDGEVSSLRSEFLHGFGFESSKGDLLEAFVAVARENRFNPVQDYLNGLPDWGGVPRLDRLLIDHAGAPDTAYVRAVTRKTLIAAVARAMQPGVKFDTVPILIGAQGWGKSRLVKALCADASWFTDALPSDLTNRDAVGTLQGKWIVEAGEAERFSRKREAEAIKAFLSRQVDRCRPPYGRLIQDFPRRVVVIGTANSESLINDPSGGRRFWPVRLGRRVDVDAVVAVRDQLWAEAFAAWQGGEPLFLDRELHDIALAEAETIQEAQDDPWLDHLATYLTTGLRADSLKVDPPDRKVFARALYSALGLTLPEQTKAVAQRVHHLMDRLGWHRKRSLRIGDRVAPGFERAALTEDA